MVPVDLVEQVQLHGLDLRPLGLGGLAQLPRLRPDLGTGDHVMTLGCEA